MAPVEIEIVGAGGFIKVAGADQPRPIDHGARVKVDKDVADQLIADGVAVKAGKTEAASSPPPSFVLAEASDDDVASWVAKSTIEDIEAAVGADEEQAARVLAAEQARGDDARKTLVEKLEELVTAS